jgi:hypothetical protein
MQWTLYSNSNKVIIFIANESLQQVSQKKVIDDEKSVKIFDSEFKNIQQIKTALSDHYISSKYGRPMGFLEVAIPTDKKTDVSQFIKKITDAISANENEFKKEIEIENKRSDLFAKKTHEIFAMYADKPEIAHAAALYKKIGEYGSDALGDIHIRRDATLQLQTMVYFYYLAETKENEIKNILNESKSDSRMEDIIKWLATESVDYNLYPIESGTIFGQDFTRLTTNSICEHLKQGLLQLNTFYMEIMKQVDYEKELFTNLIEDNYYGLNSNKSYLRTMSEMQDWIYINMPRIIKEKQENQVIPDSPLSRQSSNDESFEIPQSPILNRKP